MKVLVAGIGNIFLGDDGFGVEVARRMEHDTVPPGVRVADFGIRGVHLAYELLDGHDALVLVDAVPMGEQPGTVAVIEPDTDATVATSMDAHSMQPAVVLGLVTSMGGHVPRVVIVGCEPLTVEERIGLSEPVTAAVEPAVTTVHHVLADICSRSQEELTP